MFFSNKGKEVLVSFAVYCGFFVVGDAVFGQKGTTVALGQTLRPCFVETDRPPPPPRLRVPPRLPWFGFCFPAQRGGTRAGCPLLITGRLSCPRSGSVLTGFPPAGRRAASAGRCGSGPVVLLGRVGEFERQFHAGGDTYSFYVKMPVI